MMIFYKEDEGRKCDGIVKLFDNVTTYGALKMVLYQNKAIMPKIAKDSAQGGAHYVLFERNSVGVLDYYYPLMWI